MSLQRLMEKPKQQEKIRYSKARSGVVTIIQVRGYITEAIIGNGWVFFCPYSGMEVPILITHGGEMMPPGPYTLESVQQFLAVCSDRIH